MKVKIKDIVKVNNILLYMLENTIDGEIDLNFTTYWNVPFEDGQKLNVPSPIVNDLRDSINNLEDILCEKHSVTHSDFEDFGNIIKAIGLKLKNMDCLSDKKKRNRW